MEMHQMPVLPAGTAPPDREPLPVRPVDTGVVVNPDHRQAGGDDGDDTEEAGYGYGV